MFPSCRYFTDLLFYFGKYRLDAATGLHFRPRPRSSGLTCSICPSEEKFREKSLSAELGSALNARAPSTIKYLDNWALQSYIRIIKNGIFDASPAENMYLVDSIVAILLLYRVKIYDLNIFF